MMWFRRSKKKETKRASIEYGWKFEDGVATPFQGRPGTSVLHASVIAECPNCWEEKFGTIDTSKALRQEETAKGIRWVGVPCSACDKTFTIESDRPMELFTPTHVITHKGCLDGFGSAYAIWKWVGDSRTVYLDGEYGKPIPEVPDGAKVMMADVSYSREEMVALHERCERLLVMDHHETAQKNLEGLDFAIFDMNRSGAGITWDVVSVGAPRSVMADALEDYDLWRFELEGTKEIHMALLSVPQSLAEWDRMALALETEEGFASVLLKGQVILDYRKRVIEKESQHAHQVSLCDIPVLAINTGMRSYWSDIMHHLLDTHPTYDVVGAYVVNLTDDRVYWSFRSREGTRHALELAEVFPGGGGHPHAAGCAMPVSSLVPPKRTSGP